MKLITQIKNTEKEIDKTWNPFTHIFFVYRWYYLQLKRLWNKEKK
jgi:hypothetical protein